MIDTSNVKVSYPQFKLTHPELFSPDFKLFDKSSISPELLRTPQKIFRKYTQNASADDKSDGIYKPCLTLYRSYTEGKLEYNLHIQFSAPKLLNSNNVQEIRADELDAVIAALGYKLRTMGVEVSDAVLRQAEVTKVHFGKNMELQAPLTVAEVIAELNKADMGKRMEVNHRDYKNGGESLYFYNASRNVIFYDKVKDLGKSKGVSIDKDKTVFEKELGKRLERDKKQIARFEVRFTNGILVRSIINKGLHAKHEIITLEHVFDEGLWKSSLLDEWHTIIDRPANQLAFKTKLSIEDVFHTLVARQQGAKSNVHTLNKVLISFGLYYFINQLGVKILKNKIFTFWSKRTCERRLDEKIAQAVVELKDLPPNEIISLIERNLQEFKRHTLWQAN